jgi:hypothetical protein
MGIQLMSENVEQHNPTDSVVDVQQAGGFVNSVNSAPTRRGRRSASSADWKPKFLACLGEGRSVLDAAAISGVDASLPYKMRQEDDTFRRDWNSMCDMSSRLIEQEALRRGVRGTLRPVFYKGEIVGETREYSDSLLSTLLKGRMPKYRDNAKVSVVHNTSIFSDVANLAATLKAQDDEPKCIEVEVTTAEPQPDGVIDNGTPP